MANQIKLFHRDQVLPAYRRPFIKSGYMSCSSTLSFCLCSAFTLTNETINFWTHYLASLILAARLWTLPVDLIHDDFALPLLAFGISACAYPVTSSIAHLLNRMSEKILHVCFFFDYAAVSLYSLGSAISYNYFSFHPDLINTPFHAVFIPLAVTAGTISTVLACKSRLMKSKFGGFYRVLGFILPYGFCHYPLVYRMIFCQDGDCESDALNLHKQEMFFTISGTFLFVIHVPEYFAPGRFDIFGNSHQLFHVLGATATYRQLLAVFNDMRSRRDYLSQTLIAPPTLRGTLLPLGILTVVNLIIIWVFSKQLRKWNVNNNDNRFMQNGNKVHKCR